VIELVEAIHSFDESKLGNVDVSIKIAGGTARLLQNRRFTQRTLQARRIT